MPRRIDNIKRFKKGIETAIQIKDDLILESFKSIGDAALKVAQDSHTFDNQTRNLEDSFTYGIFHNGVLLEYKGLGSSLGVSTAISFLQGYGPRHQQPWLLVVVAGAQYSAKLEGYVRKSDGILSKAGDTLIVLNESFVFITMESILYFKTRK